MWTPDPIWPVIVLAVICVVDGVLCLKPVPFIADCFRTVGYPRRLWPLMPVIKFAAAAGLIVGSWLPVLGGLTSACLVIYFIAAIGAHVRVRDFGRNLFLNATAMFVVCLTVFLWSFVL
ncbi:MAG: DoxX family protein [Propionibacteriales bacterium]|nr:DoxX family protein [Propionibacteriales bacterium]